MKHSWMWGGGFLLSDSQFSKGGAGGSPWTPAVRAQLQCAVKSREKQGVKSGFALCMALTEWRDLQSKVSSG